MDDKLTIIGSLNQAKGSTERASRLLSLLWDDGCVRLKDDDIKQIYDIIKSMNSDIAEIRTLLKDQFEKIANSAFKQK
jgi:hypothetical protein